MSGPLGKYSQLVAAILAIVIIVGWAAAEVAFGAGAVASVPTEFTTAAMLAMGAVFGSVATVNGYKRDAEAIQKRLDVAGVPPAPAVSQP